MKNSCRIKPRIRNAKQEITESRLFGSLLRFTGDRKKAKFYYELSVDPVWVERHKHVIEYDENGEVTLETLLEYTSLYKLLSNKHYAEASEEARELGTVSGKEAFAWANKFNRHSIYKRKYIAIPVAQVGDQYKVIIRPNSARQQTLFENTEKLFVRMNLLRKKINSTNTGDSSSYFNTKQWTEEDLKFIEDIIYELENANPDDLKLTLQSNKVNHYNIARFFLDTYYNSAPQAFKDIVNNVQFQAGLGVTNEEEAVLAVVTQLLENRELENPTLLGENSFNTVKETISNFKNGYIKLKNRSGINASYKSLTTEFKNLLTDLANANLATMKAVKEVYNLVVPQMADDPYTIWGNTAAISGTKEIVEQLLLETEKTIQSLVLLDIPTSENSEVRFDKLQNAIITCRQASIYVKHINNIISIAKDISSSPAIEDKAKEHLQNTIKNLELRLKTSYKFEGLGHYTLSQLILKKSQDAWAAFLASSYGSTRITQAAHITWEGSKQNASEILIRDLVESLEHNDSLYSRFMSSMGNSNDLVNQLFYNAVTMANKVKVEQIVELKRQIEILEAKHHKNKVDTNKFFEVNEHGIPTGNYVDSVHWGNWENDFDQFKRKCFKDWKESKIAFGESQEALEFEWDLHFRSKVKQWHKTHSTYNEAKQRFEPNIEINRYNNEKAYQELTREEKIALREIKEVKTELDDILNRADSKGSEVTYHAMSQRMPQVKADTRGVYKNMRNMGYGVWKSMTSAVIDKWFSSTRLTEDDRDYGSNVTYNTIEDDLFMDKSSFATSTAKRIPLYYINKMKDTRLLTRDVYHGLLNYGHMVFSYQHANNLVDFAEVGLEVQANRDLGESSRKNANIDKNKKLNKAEKVAHSRSYARYAQFCDAHIYNLGAPKGKLFGKISKQDVDKLISTATGLSAKLFMGGNINGALINVFTGMIEIAKETIGGEFFNMDDLTKANAIYFSNIATSALQEVKMFKNTKLSLFALKFQTQNDIDETVRNYHTDRSIRIKERELSLYRLNPLGEGLMKPYAAGDHYMQMMSYLALSQHHKFKVDDNSKSKDAGKTISLWEAYTLENEDGVGRSGNRLVIRSDVKYIDPQTNETRDWTIADEQKMSNLCRTINNRMHGLYNKLDKPALNSAIWFKALSAMRNYALGLIEGNFGESKYSILTESHIEGKLVTIGKAFAYAYHNFNDKDASPMKVLLSILPCVPITKNFKQTLNEAGFSNGQIANLKKFHAQTTIMLALWLAKLLSEAPEDSEDRNVFIGYIYYNVSRLLVEQQSYWLPGSRMFEEYESITDLKPAGFQAIQQLWHIIELLVTGEEYKRDGTYYKEGDKKVKNALWSYTPWLRNLKVWQHPYEAYESYEYSRETN